MDGEYQLQLSPAQANSLDGIRLILSKNLKVSINELSKLVIVRKSIDARRGKIKVNLVVRVLDDDKGLEMNRPCFNYQNVEGKPEVIVVGAGPAGLFAALKLIELGLKPIILEQGKQVAERKRDVAMLNRNLTLIPESNYAFGEGGAGTFSDGKLYTRSNKRGDISRILWVLHNHGAQDEILYEAHPHIGTNILPRVVSSIRKTILEFGGEIIFNAKVSKLITSNGSVTGVQLSDGSSFRAKAVILATGHSARDIYHSLHQQGIAIESKPFAMGVRVEHPQELIDRIQYHGIKRGDLLPAASYNLVQQVDGRGVYSFCMCPGGYIVPAMTGEDEIVVNGMSPSSRGSKWANSGIVVEIQLSDFKNSSPLAGLELQASLENTAYQQVNKGIVAPAQRLTDFVIGNASSTLPACSYFPGVSSSRLDEWLPKNISNRLRQGFRAFDNKMKGFLTQEALVVGVESRTSSPVRIPRDPKTMQHIQIEGLFPSGEGAGYAGGIVSSAMDGERSAEALANWLNIKG